MMGTTHATTGAAAWLAGCEAATALGAHPSVLAIAVGTGVCAAGALVPDFDHPSSLASRSLWPVTAVVAWATRAVSRAVYRATSTPLDDRRGDAGRHRALTHTWPFAVVVGVMATVVLTLAGLRWSWIGGWWWLGLPLGGGCLVHTLGDALTHSGVPLWWPILSQGRRWRRVGAPLRFSTGKWFEKVVFVVAVAVGFAALWLLLPGLLPATAVPASVAR